MRNSSNTEKTVKEEPDGGALTVKNFKGPNAIFPGIDKFVAKTKPEEWNNIPLPIVETFKDLLGVLE